MMAETLWAPGEWKLFANADGSFEIHGRSQIDGASYVICSRNQIEHRRDESLANARLIITASELYEALAAIIAANDEFRATLPADWDGDPVNDACTAARAALRRARGEQSPEERA